MPSTNVFNDPQSVMAVTLKPPDGFEALYQGVSRSNPLPFVMADARDRFLPLDARAATDAISEFLARYVPVPIGATLLLLIPRALFLVETPQEELYTYELRWRLRTVDDHNTAQSQNNPTVPYSLQARLGAPEDDGTARILLPAYTSEVIVPAAVGNGQLPIVSGGAADPQVGYATQGLYVPATVGGETIAHAPNAYFAPILRRVVGNELSVVAYRTDGATEWDFQADDAGISNVYGTNQVTGGTPHPVFPNVGMLLVFLAGSPAL
jgi:hypothetical protein